MSLEKEVKRMIIKPCEPCKEFTEYYFIGFKENANGNYLPAYNCLECDNTIFLEGEK